MYLLYLYVSLTSRMNCCNLVCMAELNVCNVILSLQSFLPPSRVIKPEEGKKLADSWGAAFMESSAKENEVMMNTHFRSLCSPHC